MSFASDEAGPVRPGEELDLARLGEYLAAHLRAAGTRSSSSSSRTAIPT